jgi:hypothetical protein
MDLGSGIAIAGIAIPTAAVAITAIKTFAVDRSGLARKAEGENGNGNFPCKEHSGLVMCLENIEKNQERQEKWLGEISTDVKHLLQRK